MAQSASGERGRSTLPRRSCSQPPRASTWSASLTRSEPHPPRACAISTACGDRPRRCGVPPPRCRLLCSRARTPSRWRSARCCTAAVPTFSNASTDAAMCSLASAERSLPTNCTNCSWPQRLPPPRPSQHRSGNRIRARRQPLCRPARRLPTRCPLVKRQRPRCLTGRSLSARLLCRPLLPRNRDRE